MANGGAGHGSIVGTHRTLSTTTLALTPALSQRERGPDFDACRFPADGRLPKADGHSRFPLSGPKNPAAHSFELMEARTEKESPP